MKNKYNREEVIYKLSKKRLYPKPDIKHITFFETLEYTQIGIKLWSMLDFLDTPVKRKKWKVRKEKFERPSYFQRKSCDICKRPATRYLLIKDQHFLKCDSKKCDLAIRIKTGVFEFIGELK